MKFSLLLTIDECVVSVCVPDLQLDAFRFSTLQPRYRAISMMLLVFFTIYATMFLLECAVKLRWHEKIIFSVVFPAVLLVAFFICRQIIICRRKYLSSQADTPEKQGQVQALSSQSDNLQRLSVLLVTIAYAPQMQMVCSLVDCVRLKPSSPLSLRNDSLFYCNSSNPLWMPMVLH